MIGQATFITTSLEGDQAIQGFNFLIPVETLWQMLRVLGVTPNRDDPFMDAWEHAVAAYFQGEYEQALERLNAADKLLPGLWDVERLRFLLKDLLEFRKEITPARTP